MMARGCSIIISAVKGEWAGISETLEKVFVSTTFA
jgi:hypothetical protein